MTWDIPDGMTPRQFELKLKARGGHARLCPICKKAATAQKAQARKKAAKSLKSTTPHRHHNQEEQAP